MTTPSERMRALRQGKELLVCIRADAAVPQLTRLQAAALLDRYRELDELWLLDGSPIAGLTLAAAEVIFEAGLLFVSLRGVVGMGQDTAGIWRTVMRHYPGRDDGCLSSHQVLRLLTQGALPL